MKRILFSILVVAAVLSLGGRARAADWFLTPEGAGRKDGTSWEQSLDQGALARAANELLQPGDRLLIGGGVFKNVELTISTGGRAGRPKTILGVDRGAGLPVFASDWSIAQPAKGRVALRLGPGVSHLTIQHLRLKGYLIGVAASAIKETGARSHLIFEDVDLEQGRHGFFLSDCDDVLLTGCDLKRYSKHGFRLEGGCHRVTFRQCTADCSEGDADWENKTELLPFGFDVNNGGTPSTQVVFEDCLARNNMKPNQANRYKNGDGFVVEGNSRDVVFRRCRSLRNQDGGFDLKVPEVRLTDCVAMGNKRGFRIWTTGTLTNCLSAGGETSLWCNGGPVTATRCTFHAAHSLAVMGDDRATEPITVSDGIISAGPDAAPFRPTGRKVVLTGTIIAGPGHTDKAPDYPRPEPSWDGRGDAMDSAAYPDKGYRSTRVTPGL